MDEDKYGEALSYVNEAINSIINYYQENEYTEKQREESQELKILRETTKNIRDKWEGN